MTFLVENQVGRNVVVLCDFLSFIENFEKPGILFFRQRAQIKFIFMGSFVSARVIGQFEILKIMASCKGHASDLELEMTFELKFGSSVILGGNFRTFLGFYGLWAGNFRDRDFS